MKWKKKSYINVMKHVVPLRLSAWKAANMKTLDQHQKKETDGFLCGVLELYCLVFLRLKTKIATPCFGQALKIVSTASTHPKIKEKVR